MFDDIGASPEALGSHLGWSMSTVYRWLLGQQPVHRSCLLAMFYETRWGRDFVSSEVERDAQRLAVTVVFLRREVESLRRQLESLGRIAEFGSANDPSPQVVPSRLEARHVVDVVARESSQLALARELEMYLRQVAGRQP